MGVAFPILSRNRFSLLLRGMAMGCKKIVLLLSYPSDEVGNGLVDWDKLDEAGVDPYSDVLTLEQFRKKFGAAVHPFTGVDYIDFYSGIITDAGAEVEVIFGNRVQTLCDYTDAVITCDIHTRARSKRLLKPLAPRGARPRRSAQQKRRRQRHNAEYGLLGSNKATEETVKLFPRDCMAVAEELGERLSKASGKHIEAMVYGDGAFKDPVGKIWELADPVVSPGYTKGLVGTPNELKLKYLADNDFGDLKGGEALKEAIEERIREKTSESPGRQHGVRGHDAPPPDRPDRLALRPDERQRRQGHAHCLHSGLLRQLFQRLSHKQNIKNRTSFEVRFFVNARYSARLRVFSSASAAAFSHVPSNSSILPASTRAASFGSMGIWASRGRL